MLIVTNTAALLRECGYTVYHHDGKIRSAPAALQMYFRDLEAGDYLINIPRKFILKLETDDQQKIAVLAIAVELQRLDAFIFVHVPSNGNVDVDTDVFDFRQVKDYAPEEIVGGLNMGYVSEGFYIVRRNLGGRPVFSERYNTFSDMVFNLALSPNYKFLHPHIKNTPNMQEMGGLTVTAIYGVGFLVSDYLSGTGHAIVFGDDFETERSAKLVGSAVYMGNLVLDMLEGIDKKNTLLYNQSIGKLRELMDGLK